MRRKSHFQEEIRRSFVFAIKATGTCIRSKPAKYLNAFRPVLYNAFRIKYYFVALYRTTD
jgi:hypothetical protein